MRAGRSCAGWPGRSSDDRLGKVTIAGDIIAVAGFLAGVAGAYQRSSS
jgi:hypothetical protein